MVGDVSAEPARPARPDLPRCDLPRQLSHLQHRALPGGEPAARRLGQPHPRHRPRHGIRVAGLVAGARLARRGRGEAHGQCPGQRHQLRRRAAHDRRRRQRRLRRPPRRLAVHRLRAQRQPVRQALCRLGNRQRRQRTLLRAGAGPDLARRHVGDLRVLRSQGLGVTTRRRALGRHRMIRGQGSAGREHRCARLDQRDRSRRS